MCPFKKIFVLSKRTVSFPPRRGPSTLSRVGCRVAAPLLGLVLPVPASGGPSVAPWCSPQADLQAVLSVHVPGSRPLRSPNLLLDWSCLASMSRALLSRHADFTRGCDNAEEAASRHPRPPSNPPASVLGGVRTAKDSISSQPHTRGQGHGGRGVGRGQRELARLWLCRSAAA